MSATGNIVAALISKHWRLCQRSLLIQQFAVLAIASLLMAIIEPGRAVEAPSIAAHSVVLTSLIFLIITFLSLPVKGNKSLAGGFPFINEFSLPIPTTLLALVPLLFITLLMLVAYVVPITILSLVFEVRGPQFVYAFILVISTLMLLSLGWWTNSTIGHGLGWAVVIIIYWNQLQLPAFELVVMEGSSSLQFAEPSAYILSMTVAAALVALMLMGVKSQRHGENLFGLQKHSPIQWESFTLRNKYETFKEACPTDSAIAAENWRERQLRGPAQSVPLGIAMALLRLVALNLIKSNGGLDSAATPGEILAICLSFYWMVVFVMQMQVFGISYRAGQLTNTAFDRCRPISTARLLYIKLSNNVLSLLSAAAVMVLIYWFVGPIFLADITDNKLVILEGVSNYFSNSLTTITMEILVLSVMGLTSLFLFATVSAWFMLWPRVLSWAVSIMAAYAFLLIVFLMRFTDAADFGELDTVIRNKHLWILILGVPAATAYFSRALLREKVMDSRHLMIMLISTAAFAILYIVGNSATGFYTEEHSLEVMLWYSMLGLTPLLAITAALWTMAEIRHSGA